MNAHETKRMIDALARRVAALEAQANNQPVRLAVGGSAQGASLILVEIINYELFDDRQWIYTATRVTKATSGYGGWAQVAADHPQRTLTVYSLAEDINSGANIEQGNATTPPYLEGFEMKPIPIGSKRLAIKVALTGGVSEWWVDFINSIDGDCANTEAAELQAASQLGVA